MRCAGRQRAAGLPRRVVESACSGRSSLGDGEQPWGEGRDLGVCFRWSFLGPFNLTPGLVVCKVHRKYRELLQRIRVEACVNGVVLDGPERVGTSRVRSMWSLDVSLLRLESVRLKSEGSRKV